MHGNHPKCQVFSRYEPGEVVEALGITPTLFAGFLVKSTLSTLSNNNYNCPDEQMACVLVRFNRSTLTFFYRSMIRALAKKLEHFEIF